MVSFISQQANLQDYNANSPYNYILYMNASWIIFRLIYIIALPRLTVLSVHLQRQWYQASEMSASVLEMSQRWFRKTRTIFRWIKMLGLSWSGKRGTNDIIWKECLWDKKSPTRVIFAHEDTICNFASFILVKFYLSIDNSHFPNIFNLKKI